MIVEERGKISSREMIRSNQDVLAEQKTFMSQRRRDLGATTLIV